MEEFDFKTTSGAAPYALMLRRRRRWGGSLGPRRAQVLSENTLLKAPHAANAQHTLRCPFPLVVGCESFAFGLICLSISLQVARWPKSKYLVFLNCYTLVSSHLDICCIAPCCAELPHLLISTFTYNHRPTAKD